MTLVLAAPAESRFDTHADWIRIKHFGNEDYRYPVIWIAERPFAHLSAGDSELIVVDKREYETIGQFVRRTIEGCRPWSQRDFVAVGQVLITQSKSGTRPTQCMLRPAAGCTFLSNLINLDVGDRFPALAAPIVRLGQILDCRERTFRVNVK
jgi:hypothetical protein